MQCLELASSGPLHSTDTLNMDHRSTSTGSGNRSYSTVVARRAAQKSVRRLLESLGSGVAEMSGAEVAGSRDGLPISVVHPLLAQYHRINSIDMLCFSLASVLSSPLVTMG